MRSLVRGKLTYGNVVATIALFAALTGGIAWALERNSVKSKHIVDNQVKSADLRDGGVEIDDISPTAAIRREDPADGAGVCSANQSIPGNGVTTQLLFTTSQFDILGNQDSDPTCDDPGRGTFLVPEDGVYLLTAGVLWPGDDTDGKRTLYIDAAGRYAAQSEIDAASSGATLQNVSATASLISGDQVRTWVSQTSGSALNVGGVDSRNFMTVTWLGPLD